MPKRIRFEGHVGSELTTETVSQALDELGGEEVVIDLHTVGGFVYDGFEIYNRIAQYQGKKTVVLGGLVASIGTYIATAFDLIQAQDSSVYMLHNGQGFVIGDYKAMEKEAKELERLNRHIASRLAARSGRSVDDILSLMNEETWLYGQEIVDYGFADELVEAGQNIEREDAIQRAAQERDKHLQRVAESYRLRAAHAQDIHRAAKRLRLNVIAPYSEEAPLVDEEWDSSQSETRWREHAGVESNDDLPNGTYSKRFAWRDPDSKETFGGYKLPHWDFKEGREFVNIRAVRNILARLSQTDGIPSDERRQIEDNMNRYLERFDNEQEENSAVGANRFMQRGNLTMNKEELLNKLQTLRANGDITLQEIAKSLGMENQLVTEEAQNAVKLVERFNAAGVKDIESEFERLKSKAAEADQAKRENELTEAFGPEKNQDGTENLARQYAEQRLNADSGLTVEKVKEDSIMQKLLAERADYQSNHNSVGQVDHGFTPPKREGSETGSGSHRVTKV